MKPPIDYKNLRTYSDIKIAKEKLKYSILLHEDMLSKSVDALRGNVVSSLKQSAWKWGMKVAVSYLMSQINSQNSKKEK